MKVAIYVPHGAVPDKRGFAPAIVAADLPSLHEVLGENEAVWVKPGDPASLAAGIRSLADNPEKARQMGSLMRDRVKPYTWDERAKRLAGIMRSIV